MWSSSWEQEWCLNPLHCLKALIAAKERNAFLQFVLTLGCAMAGFPFVVYSPATLTVVLMVTEMKYLAIKLCYL